MRSKLSSAVADVCLIEGSLYGRPGRLVCLRVGLLSWWWPTRANCWNWSSSPFWTDRCAFLHARCSLSKFRRLRQLLAGVCGSLAMCIVRVLRMRVIISMRLCHAMSLHDGAKERYGTFKACVHSTVCAGVCARFLVSWLCVDGWTDCAMH